MTHGFPTRRKIIETALHYLGRRYEQEAPDEINRALQAVNGAMVRVLAAGGSSHGMESSYEAGDLDDTLKISNLAAHLLPWIVAEEIDVGKDFSISKSSKLAFEQLRSLDGEKLVVSGPSRHTRGMYRGSRYRGYGVSRSVPPVVEDPEELDVLK